MTHTLRQSYDIIREEAESLAGAPGDIPQRVKKLHEIFLDSQGNHGFPEVALHGALWAYTFFEEKGKLGRILRLRYFYNRKERNYRMGMLLGFTEGFKAANRLVFIDTWTNYWFSKLYGKEAGASELIDAGLLEHLNRIHDAVKAGQKLPAEERRAAFISALRVEQERCVAPRIQEEIRKFTCPILTTLCLKPVVKFRYFPRGKKFWFRNFSDQEERVNNATASYDIAEAIGWERVMQARLEYGVAL